MVCRIYPKYEQIWKIKNVILKILEKIFALLKLVFIRKNPVGHRCGIFSYDFSRSNPNISYEIIQRTTGVGHFLRKIVSGHNARHFFQTLEMKLISVLTGWNFLQLVLLTEDWENLKKVLPEVDFPFYEDNPKVKEMAEEPLSNRKMAFVKTNIGHCYICY